MSSIPFDLTKIKAFVLDMDGVISANVSPIGLDGMPMRTVNVKDGYAMQYAVKQGYTIAIISGGASEAMEQRFRQLGAAHVYMRISDKAAQLEVLCRESGLRPEELAYIGDDIPDITIMKRVALPCAPADAAPEVKSVAKYISLCNGGYGVVRDVIEQTLRANDCWSLSAGFGW